MSLKLQPFLEDYFCSYEGLNKRSLELFLQSFSPICAFKDPYHDISGQDSLRELLLYRMDNIEDIQFRILDFSWGRKVQTAYINWEMHYYDRHKKSISTNGMSELYFSLEGKIIALCEFWGHNYPLLNDKKYQKIIFS